MKRALCALLCALVAALPAAAAADDSEFSFAADSAQEDDSADEAEKDGWDDMKFPQWAKDLRRFEIITFGSAPFVAVWTTLAYSLAAYGEFHNPLDKGSSYFSSSDQRHIMEITAAACVAVGVADLVVTLVKRRRAARERAEEEERRPVKVYAGSGLPPPDGEHLQGGIESAVF